MKKYEELLLTLTERGPTCDRCLSVLMGLPRPQSVNTPGRRLLDKGRAVRTVQVCSHCGETRNLLSPCAPDYPCSPVGLGKRGAAKARSDVSRLRVKAPSIMNGTLALEKLVARAGYESMEHAVAAHTLFLHPDTVRQTMGKALFPMVRGNARKGVHQLRVLPDGRQVWMDNNIPVKRLFLWAARRANGPDIQCNHVWNTSNDPDGYTALWNLCMTPAFLAKATDSRGPVKDLLQYRAYDLYGHLPAGYSTPERPPGYDSLEWLPFPDPVHDLQAHIRAHLAGRPSTSPGNVARQLGWLYSDWMADTALELHGNDL